MTFKDSVLSKSEESIENDLLSQVYINSKICTIKFEYYNKAMKNFFSLFVTLLALFVLIITKSIV